MMIFLSKDLRHIVTTTSQVLCKKLLEDDRLMYLGFTRVDASLAVESKSVPRQVWPGSVWLKDNPLFDIQKFHRPNVYVRITSQKDLSDFVLFCDNHKLGTDNFSFSEIDSAYLSYWNNDICINTVSHTRMPTKNIVDEVILNISDIKNTAPINEGDQQ